MRQRKHHDRRSSAPMPAGKTVAASLSTVKSAPAAGASAAGYRLEKPLVCVLLVFAAWVAFGSLLRDDFEFFYLDDDEYVTKNPQVQAGLTADSIRWAFTTFHSHNWHPVTWLSLQLDYTLFGVQPSGYRLTNILLHAANAVLLFLWLQYVVRDSRPPAPDTGAAAADAGPFLWRSALVAALFLLHPQRVESVAWIAERKDVLSTLFWMLSLWAYAWYVRKPSSGRYALLLVTFALGLMAKQMLVTLPCVLLLLDCWPLSAIRQPRWERLVVEKLPLFALAAGACVLTFLAQESYRQPLDDLSLAVRINNALVAYVRYLGYALWPVGLCFYYPHLGQRLPLWQGVASGIFLAIVTACCLSHPGRRRPYLAVGWLWFLGTLVPVIGIVQVGNQALADRYSYVPLIGIAWLAVWGVSDAAIRFHWPKPVLAASAAAILLTCLVLTWKQVQTWQSTQTVWERVVAAEPNCALGHVNVGESLASKGMPEEALRQLREAVAVEPESATGQLQLGMFLHRLRRWDEATPHFAAALRLNPKLVEARYRLGVGAMMTGDLTSAVHHYAQLAELAPDLAEARDNLGVALLFQGKLDEAQQHLAKAVELSPGLLDAHNKLGLLFLLRGNTKEAEKEFQQALQLDAGDPAAHFYLGWVLHSSGAADAARQEFAAGLKLRPGWPAETARLAAFLATNSDPANRHGPLALQQAQIACEAVREPDAELLDALAAALAEVGRFPDAVTAAKKALALSDRAPELRAAREKRLQLYEQGQPYREKGGEVPSHPPPK